MKKYILPFSAIMALVLFFTACEEKDLTEDNPAPPGDNILMSFIPFYGEEGLSTDSFYQNQAGQKFTIDTVMLLVSDFQFFTSSRDTLGRSEQNLQLFSTGDPEKLLARLPAGGYSGEFFLKMGSDTSNFLTAGPIVFERFPSMARMDGFGFNFFKITGRLINPADPDDSVGTIPLDYTLGGFQLADSAKSETRTFSIDHSRPLRLITTADLKPLLHNLNMLVFQEVKSDPTDAVDLSVSKAMRDSLRINIF